MADYIVKDTELTSVANAIRTAGGTNSLLSFPNGFVSAVNSISGGGSSDFSTATVTVINNDSADAFPITVACASSWEYNTSQGSTYVEPSSTASFTAILFKGRCELYCLWFQEHTITLSGDITDDGMNYYIITGNCTITIS